MSGRRHGRAYGLAAAGRAHAQGYGAATAAFVPTQLSGCTLWLRADMGVTDAGGGKCSAWADQSGNGRNFTQGIDANRPIITASAINGRQALRFDSAASQRLSNGTALSSFITASAWTAFAVFNYTGASAVSPTSYSNPALIADSSSYCGLYNSTTRAVAYCWDGADKSARPTITTSTNYYLTAQLSGGNIVANVNAGSNSTTASGNVSTLTGTMHLGGVSVYHKGDIGEIIMYNRALSAGELTQVQAYLASYWGI